MRIRTIKPSFWRSDDITALPMDVRLLFIGLWSYVDDNGVGLDDYRQIAADLFALEEDQEGVRKFIREGLATLSQNFLVIRYKIEDRPCLFIPTWDLHQKIDHKGKIRYQRPPAGFDPTTSGNSHHDDPGKPVSRDSRESLSTVSPRARVAGRGEEGIRGTGEKDPCGEDLILSTDRANKITSPSNHDLATQAVTTMIGTSRPRAIRDGLINRAVMLLNDGAQGIDLTEGLSAWRNTPNARVTWLDHKVSDAASRRESASQPKPPPKSTTDERVQACLDRGALYREAVANGYTTPAEQFAYAARKQGEPSLADVIALPGFAS